MAEEKPVCPKCGSELIVPLANERHCNQCGHSFGLVRDPIARAAQASKEARSAKTGYQPHKHGRGA
jgi:tRNA(Ile2) C34 agmatinyltransferase TiaS